MDVSSSFYLIAHDNIPPRLLDITMDGHARMNKTAGHFTDIGLRPDRLIFLVEHHCIP